MKYELEAFVCTVALNLHHHHHPYIVCHWGEDNATQVGSFQGPALLITKTLKAWQTLTFINPETPYINVGGLLLNHIALVPRWVQFKWFQLVEIFTPRALGNSGDICSFTRGGHLWVEGSWMLVTMHGTDPTIKEFYGLKCQQCCWWKLLVSCTWATLSCLLSDLEPQASYVLQRNFTSWGS